MNQHADNVPPSVGVDVGGIETLLRRNLPDVFGEAIRLAARPRYARVALPAAEATSAKLGVRVHMAPVRTTEDLREAFASMAREGADGVFVMASSFTRSNAAILAELALKHQLPNMFGARENVEAGGLMSYAPDLRDLTRRAAVYIDKILRGTKPADLPVEQATRFEFVINLKTATTLGLKVPPMLLAHADEVIE